MVGWLVRTCVDTLVAAAILLGPQAAAQAQWYQPPQAPEKILRQLETPTSLEFIETPLGDVVDYLRDYHGVDIRMDLKALKKAKVSTEEPITRNLRGISLRSALRLMLSEIGLTYVVDKDHLRITTPQAARSQLLTFSYPIGELSRPEPGTAHGQLDATAFTAAITSTVAPQTWLATGGRGTIATWPLTSPTSLAVAQTGPVQDEVVELLSRVRRVAAGGRGLDAAEWELHEALAMPTTMDFIETPLQDVVDYLKDLHHIEIQLDHTAMDAAEIGADAPITVNFKRVMLKKALHSILDKHGLSCVVADQVLLITTAKEAQQRWLVKAYRLKPDDALRIAPGAQPGGKAVVEKITATIAPKTWRPVGGGAIAPVSLGKYDVLVVRQTFDVHWQIAGLLNPVLADRPERTGK